MNITTFQEMIAAAQEAGPIPVAVAAAHDPEVLKAIDRAQREGMVEATLVGDWVAIEAYVAQTSS
jgi:phosphate butyryltransferase